MAARSPARTVESRLASTCALVRSTCHGASGVMGRGCDNADTLIRDYGIRIPVVAVDGVELFEISVDPAALRAAVGA